MSEKNYVKIVEENANKAGALNTDLMVWYKLGELWWREPSKDLLSLIQNEKPSLRMISYPGGDFTKLQKQLQSILSEFSNDEKKTVNICATGIGSNLHKKKLEEHLKLRYQILNGWSNCVCVFKLQ